MAFRNVFESRFGEMSDEVMKQTAFAALRDGLFPIPLSLITLQNWLKGLGIDEKDYRYLSCMLEFMSSNGLTEESVREFRNTHMLNITSFDSLMCIIERDGDRYAEILERKIFRRMDRFLRKKKNALVELYQFHHYMMDNGFGTKSLQKYIAMSGWKKKKLIKSLELKKMMGRQRQNEIEYTRHYFRMDEDEREQADMWIQGVQFEYNSASVSVEQMGILNSDMDFFFEFHKGGRSDPIPENGVSEGV